MATRTTARHRRAVSAHTDWCARDHRCNLGEHRSPETIAALPGAGRAAITRVQTTDGREYAEVHAQIPLHSTDTGARWQLRTLLRGLDQLLRHVTVRPGVLPSRTGAERPAIDRRAA